MLEQRLNPGLQSLAQGKNGPALLWEWLPSPDCLFSSTAEIQICIWNATLVVGLLVPTTQRLAERMHFSAKKRKKARTGELQKGQKWYSSTWNHYIWNQLSQYCLITCVSSENVLRKGVIANVKEMALSLAMMEGKVIYLDSNSMESFGFAL